MNNIEFQKEGFLLEKIYQLIKKNYTQLSTIWLSESTENKKLNILVYQKNDKKYNEYVFLLFENNSIIGYKLWIVKLLPNNKMKIFANFSKSFLPDYFSFSDTLYIDQNFRRKGYGKKLFIGSLEFILESLKHNGEIEIVVMSKVPDFHKKIIETFNMQFEYNEDSKLFVVKK